MEELGVSQGDLQAMDRVRIVGLTSEQGLHLNGRIGTIMAISGDNDGTANPYVARLPGNRYKVRVEFEETRGREHRPGSYNPHAKTKSYTLKRENLEPHDVSLGTLARSAEGAAALREAGLTVESTAEADAREPGAAGWFPAILQGDVTRAREILEYIKTTYGVDDAADRKVDATGDSALVGGIQKGHLGIVKLLIEYGANVNRTCNMPVLREYNLSYTSMAIMMIEKVKDGEAIVNALLDAGADVNASSSKGTPLALATQIASDQAMRLRLCRKLLDLGADPNQIINTALSGQGRNQSTVLIGVSSMQSGGYSESDRLELLRMILDAGADPGVVVTMDSKGEACTAIHIVVSRRQANVLRCLLSTEKGRAAVDVIRREYAPCPPGENNGDGETALTMAVAGPNLVQNRADRECAVLLLQAGADPKIEDSMGISAAMWLNDPTPKHRELKRLVKKARREGPSFWDSEEARAFIEDGDDDNLQCPQCLIWSDQKQYYFGQEESGFQRCSKCKNIHYCSRACQKKHWKQHKTVCTPPSATSS